MEKRKSERVVVLIDGSNFYYSTAKMGKKIDFLKLINELVGNRELVNAYYYVAPLDIEADEKKYWSHQRFLDVLRKMPKFNVVLCNLKRIKKEDGKFEYIIKGDDALLIRDLMLGAFRNLYDPAIVVSGDEDFAPIIKTVQEFGKKVGNAYFKSSSSQALRQVCDFSIPLDKIIPRTIYKKDREDSALP